MDGGREAGPIMTRYVSRALRAFSSQHAGYSEQVGRQALARSALRAAHCRASSGSNSLQPSCMQSIVTHSSLARYDLLHVHAGDTELEVDQQGLDRSEEGGQHSIRLKGYWVRCTGAAAAVQTAPYFYRGSACQQAAASASASAAALNCLMCQCQVVRARMYPTAGACRNCHLV